MALSLMSISPLIRGRDHNLEGMYISFNKQLIYLFRSPGFGIFLTAETNQGVFYHGEAISRPVDSSAEPATAEEIGQEAANSLMMEIYKVGRLFKSKYI